MDMRVDGNWLAERPVNRFQLGIARFGHRCTPGTLRTAVHQRHGTVDLTLREDAQPFEPFVSQRFTGPRRHIPDGVQNRLRPGRLTRKLVQRLGPSEHFIRIASHALPAEIADAIHNLRGICSPIGQIAAMEDQVGGGLAQICQYGFKRGSIAVDVGHDSNAQLSSPLLPATSDQSLTISEVTGSQRSQIDLIRGLKGPLPCLPDAACDTVYIRRWIAVCSSGTTATSQR